jgi:eukaryotic-like serine/threonine-protein kinase
MTPERWRQIEEIFQTIIERPPDERKSLLTQYCGGDAELRHEVESLLDYETADAFIQEPIKGAAQSLSDELREDLIGRRLGAYRVTRLVGHGGMGAVYEATRADDQFDQQVAIKIIKRGMDTDFARERFTREQRILARLEHPHIARLIDGGATEDGLPYFVMEYVEGRPIGEYCDANQLSITERLKLFRQVCAAVQFAHQNLVVHRDIKPSNILAPPDGAPKLLDFGIAKLVNPDISDDPAHTRTELRMLTPDYASPEQVRGLAITTASDIYSLGAVLYELLTGQRPHRFKSYSMSEIERVVCEAETEKPSAAVARETAAPAKLRKQLAGDLDNIILMAMRKEPERRYQSVEQFSEDIRRHLEGLPVIARNDTFTYCAGKFARRHKLGIAAVTLVILSLAGGIVATTHESRIARAERARAEIEQARAERNLAEAQAQRIEAEAQRTEAIRQRTEAETQRAEALSQRSSAERQRAEAETQRERAERRFTQVRKLANTFLFDFYDKIQNLPGSTEAREMLVKTALEYLDSLAQEAEGDASLQKELVTAYLRVGDVQGYPNRANLGQTAAALESYRRSVEIAEKLRASGRADDSLLRVLADTYAKTARIEIMTGKISKAKERIQNSLDIAERLFSSGSKDAVTYRLILNGYHELGEISMFNGDETSLTTLNRKIVEINERWVEEQHTERSRNTLVLSYEYLGDALIKNGDLNGARENYLRASAIQNELSKEAPNNTGYLRMQSNIYVRLGDVARDMGEAQAAAEYYRQALAICEDLASKDPKNTLARLDIRTVSSYLGAVLLENDPKQAAELFGKALDSGSGAKPTASQYRVHQVFNYINLSRALWLTGDHQNALKNLREAHDLIQAVPARRLYEMGIYAHSAQSATGILLLEMGDYPGALEQFRLALKNAQERIAEKPLALSMRRGLADCYERLGKYHSTLAAQSGAQVENQITHLQQARDWYRKSLETLNEWAKLTAQNNYSARRAEAAALAIAQCDAALTKLSATPHR